jgi:hypothetical protein
MLTTLLSPGLCQLWPGVPYFGGLPPLAVLADHPLSVARQVSKVPLILVPRQQITMLNNVHISGVSPTQPLVTCKSQQQTWVSFLAIFFINKLDLGFCGMRTKRPKLIPKLGIQN